MKDKIMAHNLSTDGLCRTLKAQYYKNGRANFLTRDDGFAATCVVKRIETENEKGEMEREYRIRKLTPRECFRLMDVSDDDITKIQDSGICKSAQYKMAGNSIVVSCLYEIFKQMLYKEYGKEGSKGVIENTDFDDEALF